MFGKEVSHHACSALVCALQLLGNTKPKNDLRKLSFCEWLVMKPAPTVPPWWGITVQEEQIYAAIFRAEGVSLGENFEQFLGFWLRPEAFCQEAAQSSNRPGTRAHCSAAERLQRRTENEKKAGVV